MQIYAHLTNQRISSGYKLYKLYRGISLINPASHHALNQSNSNLMASFNISLFRCTGDMQKDHAPILILTVSQGQTGVIYKVAKIMAGIVRDANIQIWRCEGLPLFQESVIWWVRRRKRSGGTFIIDRARL